MKKSLICLLFLIIGLSSTAFAASVNQDSEQIKMAEVLNISELSGAISYGNGSHSGHQTRVLHTSHGDYVAYLSCEIKNGGVDLNEFSIIKVSNGEATILYQDYIVYDTSSISIFADENEEVYAATLNGNKFNTLPGEKESANLAIWHVDSATDKVTGYTATLQFDVTNGYGYAQPAIDTVSHKIYALFSGGDEPGIISWFIFDLETMSWESKSYSIDLPTRYCYHYAYADGKGGLVIVSENDRKAATAGYPEIATAPFWSANYVWDRLDMFYIPDMYNDSLFYTYTVQDADYSRVRDLDGDGKYESDDERQTNLYPGVLNNHSGDTFLDADGYLHVLYTMQYMTAAWDRRVVEETQWHEVFDISDPSNVILLSKQQLFFDGYVDGFDNENHYGFRMVQSTDGTLYIIAIREDTGTDAGRLLVYKLIKAESGYKYSLIYKSDRLIDDDFGAAGFSISGSRNLSVNDNTVSFVVPASVASGWVSGPNENHDQVDWYYLTLKLPVQAPLEITTTTLSDSYVNKEYRQVLKTVYTGTKTLIFSAKGLPIGLHMNADTGEIYGTPPVTAQSDKPYKVTVMVTDGTNTDSKMLELWVRSGEDTPTQTVKYAVTINGSYATCTGAGEYKEGELVYIDAGIRSGYSFESWTTTSSDVVITNVTQKNASFKMPAHSVDVTAHWSYIGDEENTPAVTYLVTATADSGGSILPSGKIYIVSGEDKTFTITPDTGYMVSDVLVDGKSVGAVNYYSFTNVTKSHNIVVKFTKADPNIDVSNPFVDVKETDWFFKDVMYAYNKGIMNGTGNGLFAPDASVTRGMIVTILWRLEGSQVSGGSRFDDVKPGYYYTDAVTWAAENSIVTGYGNNMFGPDDLITREQMAMILYRFAAYKGYDITAVADLSKFTDGEETDMWATTAVAWANAEGLINGISGGLLNPQGEATRCQFAAILHRFCDKYGIV